MYFRARIVFVLVALVLHARSESPAVTTTLEHIIDETTLLNEVDSSTSRLSMEDSDESVVNFAANADDLEDVLLKEAATPFKGLQLEESSTTKKTVEINGDLRNVYKVHRIKTPAGPIRKAKSEINKPDHFDSFEVYKQLFDQSQWSWDDISKVLKGQCAKDMHLYLDGLEDQVKWALQGEIQIQWK